MAMSYWAQKLSKLCLKLVPLPVLVSCFSRHAPYCRTAPFYFIFSPSLTLLFYKLTIAYWSLYNSINLLLNSSSNVWNLNFCCLDWIFIHFLTRICIISSISLHSSKSLHYFKDLREDKETSLYRKFEPKTSWNHSP